MFKQVGAWPNAVSGFAYGLKKSYFIETDCVTSTKKLVQETLASVDKLKELNVNLLAPFYSFNNVMIANGNQ